MNVTLATPATAYAPTSAPVAPERLGEQRELIQEIKAINASGMLGDQNMLTFVLDSATRRTVVRIVDRETNEVVSQLPPEEVLRVAREQRLLDR